MHTHDFALWTALTGAAGLGLALLARRYARLRLSRPQQRRRKLLLLLLLPGLAVKPGHTAGPAPGKVLAKLRLHNTDADSPQAAPFITPMFGHAFRRGDVPAGERPRFALPDGTDCPATLWAISSWPDGSMKFCAAMARVPATLQAGGMLELHVGTGPRGATTAPRSTADFANADIAVVLEGITALDGTWTSSLGDGLKAGADVVEIANGPAGAIWRIGAEFRNRNGAEHGQLYCWHYVAALNGPANALLGLRYLGRVAQPWADVRKPAAQHREFSASLHANGKLLRAMRGHRDTETPGDVIRLPHYASFFTAGADGRWDTVPTTTTRRTDSTVSVEVDPAYFVASRLVPPYDLRTPVDAAAPIDYLPMGRGTVMRYMGTTGERDDIGLLPEWNVRHLITQNAGHERVIRVNALSSGGWRVGLRKRATRQPIPCVDLKPRYEGLGRPETDWRGYAYMQGVVKPEPNLSLWAEDAAHRPGCVYWPYLFTGEPQYLDLLTEQAFAHILGTAQGNDSVWGTDFPRRRLLDGQWAGERGVRVGPEGKLYKGAGLLMHGTEGARGSAWRSRDVAQAAAVAPDQPADGAATRAYLRDVMQSAYAAFADYTGRMPRSFSESGLFVQADANGQPWQNGYLSWSICHQADILDSKDAAHVREYLSRFWSAYARQADLGCMVAYICTYWNPDGTMVTRTEDVLGDLACTLVFDSTSATVQIEAGKNARNSAWRPTNGDAFTFVKKRSPELASLMPGREQCRLYAVNCRGQQFQLAEQPGGPPSKLPNATCKYFFARLKDFSPDFAFESTNSAYGYLANIAGAVAYHAARGDDVAAAASQLQAKMNQAKVNFRNRPKYSTAL